MLHYYRRRGLAGKDERNTYVSARVIASAADCQVYFPSSPQVWTVGFHLLF